MVVVDRASARSTSPIPSATQKIASTRRLIRPFLRVLRVLRILVVRLYACVEGKEPRHAERAPEGLCLVKGCDMAQIPIALQMYTLRNESARDFAGTLREVAKIGYAGVELAGTGGLSAAELRRLLDDLNLRAAGSHTGLDALEGDPSAALDYTQAIG